MNSSPRKGRNFPSLASYMGRRSHFQAAMRSANNACSDILEEDSSNISTNQVNQSFATIQGSAMLRECCKQRQTEVSNKIHKTWRPPFSRASTVQFQPTFSSCSGIVSRSDNIILSGRLENLTPPFPQITRWWCSFR